MKELNSTISEVTVFLDRAQITRNSDIILNKGDNRFKTGSLPGDIDENSIQVKLLGDGVLKDIRLIKDSDHNGNHTLRQELIDNKKVLGEKLSEITVRMDLAQKERNLIDKIAEKITSPLEGDKSELDPEKWDRILEFYRSKRRTVDEEIREISKEENGVREKIEKLDSQLEDLDSQRGKKKREIEISIKSETETTSSLLLSYIVKGPCWTPYYDLRVDSITKKMEIYYHGKIIQNTGEDWNDAALYLSTSKPQTGGDEPDLLPWNIDILRKGRITQLTLVNNDENHEVSCEDGKGEARVKTNLSSYLFKIQGKSNIKSDNTFHETTITIESFDATFEYSSVPKLSSHVFLKSHVKNVSQFLFLPGEANVFIDNSFVAKSKIGSVSPDESFTTSLGIDDGIKIRYSFLRKFQMNDSFFHKRNRYIYEYEIEIVNDKKTREKIEIKDQLPVSGSDYINVTLLEPKNEKNPYNLSRDRFNFVKWTCEIESGEKIVIPFSFSVEYSKELEITGMD